MRRTPAEAEYMKTPHYRRLQETLAFRVRSIRTAEGLSVQRAAELSGVSATTIRRIEAGGGWRILMLYKLGLAFGRPMADFFKPRRAPKTATEARQFKILRFLLGGTPMPRLKRSRSVA